MTFEQIAKEYSWNSTGFAIAVETHLGYGISREEIERIASKAATPAEFHSIWENEDFWTDANN